jgi:hypothetical protein
MAQRPVLELATVRTVMELALALVENQEVLGVAGAENLALRVALEMTQRQVAKDTQVLLGPLAGAGHLA